MLLLDEPVNGLDPEGIRWIRNLLKSLAAEGRTVFVSSHLMSEMALTATEVIVVGRGRLITSGSVEDVVRTAATGAVLVRTAQADRLSALLIDHGCRGRAFDAGHAHGDRHRQRTDRTRRGARSASRSSS